jgi:hypothetical protein
MCAEIAACSGRQTKRGPVYIWHGDVDEGALIALDIATDFLPGVTHAKTAYDAYTRIQNGEDPVDVLVAASGDAALGLIPGLKAGKKLGKALDKAEDVADAAGDVKTAAGKAFSSGRAPHSANVTVYRNGDAAHVETLSSGNMTATEAALGFPKSSLATHTEARAAGIPLQRGDTMIIEGQYPPCPSCKGAMNKAAASSEAEIHYMWGSQTWVAGGD